MTDFQEIISRITNFGCDHASYWGNALAGEVGEACNLIKKFERDIKEWSISDLDEFLGKLGEELADVFIYTVLTAQHFELDIEAYIIEKLNKIHKRRNK